MKILAVILLALFILGLLLYGAIYDIVSYYQKER